MTADEARELARAAREGRPPVGDQVDRVLRRVRSAASLGLTRCQADFCDHGSTADVLAAIESLGHRIDYIQHIGHSVRVGIEWG